MSRSLRIALLGATGRVGGLYLRLALDAGHRVVALVRDPDKLENQDFLEVVRGDATNPEDVAKIVADADVVVSCIGGAKNEPVMERTAQAVLDVARSQISLPKCIFISSLGCGNSSWLIKVISIMLGGRKTFYDYDRADARISKETSVPYVLVRPTGSTDLPGTGGYSAVRSGGTFANRIPRADVAKFLFEATVSTEWDGLGAVHLGGAKSPA